MSSMNLVARCNVKFCRNTSRDFVLFHIPLSGDESLEWIRLSGDLKLLDSSPKFLLAHVQFCTRHFQTTDFVVPTSKDVAGNKLSLKFGAIPSRFHPNHQPIPKEALVHWLKQYPVIDLKLSIGFYNYLLEHHSGGQSSEPPLQIRQPAPIKRETEEVIYTNPLRIQIEDMAEVKQEPASPLQETVSSTFCNYSTAQNVPVMQMLLDAHLGQRPGKIMVPSSAQPVMAHPNRILLMQVKKLPKRTPQATASATILPASQSVIKFTKEEIVKESKPLHESHQKVTKSFTPIKLATDSPMNVQIGKRNLDGNCKHVVPTENTVQQNESDAGRRIILLRVEKLNKCSSPFSANQNQVKENTTPNGKNCDLVKENGGTLVQSQETTQTFLPQSGPLLDVCPNETSTHSVRSIKSSVREENFFRESTSSKDEFTTQRADSCSHNKSKKSVSKGKKGTVNNLRKIRRLQVRVFCLENLLHKLVDDKLVPNDVKKTIWKTLRRSF